jgi:hypothetical protein
MGLLSKGTPLPWAEARVHADEVRARGIQQLLAIYHAVRGRVNDQLLWGDEVPVPLFFFLKKCANPPFHSVSTPPPRLFPGRGVPCDVRP